MCNIESSFHQSCWIRIYRFIWMEEIIILSSNLFKSASGTGAVSGGGAGGSQPPLCDSRGGRAPPWFVRPPPVHPPGYWHQVIKLFNTFWLIFRGGFKGGASNSLCYLTFFFYLKSSFYINHKLHLFKNKVHKNPYSLLNSLWDPLIM